MSIEQETPWLYNADANQAVKTTIDALYSGKYQGRSLHSHPDAMRDLANMLWNCVTHGAIEWDMDALTENLNPVPPRNRR